MKKIKIVSLIVILLSVVGLGIILGQKVFHWLESKSMPPALASSNKDAAPPAVGTAVAASRPLPAVSAGASVPPPASVSPTTTTGAVRDNGSREGGSSGVAPAAAPSPAVATVASVAAAPETLVALVAGNAVNVRQGPSTSHKKVQRIPAGSRCDVKKRENGWTQVEFAKGKTGWIRDDLLTFVPLSNAQTVQAQIVASFAANLPPASPAKPGAPAAPAAPTTVTVAIAKPAPPSKTVKSLRAENPTSAVIGASPAARIRAEPSTRSAEVGKVLKGLTVSISSKKTIGKWTWYEVKSPDGKKHGWTREDNLRFD